MVSMEMNYREYCDYVEKIKKESVDYLVDISYFDYLYEQVLKRTNYPRLEFDNTKVDIKIVKNNVLNNTKDILTGVDLSVKWLDEDTRKKLEFKYGLDAHRYIMEEAHLGSVFDIPLVSSDSYTSYIKHYKEQSENFKDIVYNKIALIDDFATETIESSYIHELGHALVGRNWCTVINPLLDEYISHCLEMYYNFFILKDPVIFMKKLIPRMKERADSSMFLNKNYRHLGYITKGEVTYLVALFLSCITFEKYDDFNQQAKKEMENDFKTVLNCECILEDFLKKYDINLHTNESVVLFRRTIDRVKSYKL